MSSSHGEEICRRTLECIFGGRKFLSERCVVAPHDDLELDGVNHDLRIAFEYQGPHHYYNVILTDRCLRYSDTEVSQRNLDTKREWCKRRRYRLLIIPFTIPYETLPFALLRIMRQAGIRTPRGTARRLAKNADDIIGKLSRPEKAIFINLPSTFHVAAKYRNWCLPKKVRCAKMPKTASSPKWKNDIHKSPTTPVPPRYRRVHSSGKGPSSILSNGTSRSSLRREPSPKDRSPRDVERLGRHAVPGL